MLNPGCILVALQHWKSRSVISAYRKKNVFSDITLTGCSEIRFTLNRAQIHKSPEKAVSAWHSSSFQLVIIKCPISKAPTLPPKKNLPRLALGMQKCTWSSSAAVEEEPLMRRAGSALAPSLEQSWAARTLGVLGGVLGTELALPGSSPPRNQCSVFWFIPNNRHFQAFLVLCACSLNFY